MQTIFQVPSIKQIEENFKNLKAIIFDMDGTLLNSEILHAKALNELLKSKNINVDTAELLDRFIGVAEPDILQMLIEMKIIDSQTTLDEFISLKNSYFEKYLELSEYKGKIISADILQFLESAKKSLYKLAIVTASERSTTTLFIDKLNISHLFDFIITRDDTEKSKPDPMPYLYAFEKLKVKAEESLIFEDSQTGLASAVASNGNVFKVKWYD
jgi:beta-phosphoglucomutase